MTTQQTKDSKEPHIHDFAELVEKVVPLRKYVTEHGKSIPDIITGKDILKQRKCTCGAVETYDIERKVA